MRGNFEEVIAWLTQEGAGGGFTDRIRSFNWCFKSEPLFASGRNAESGLWIRGEYLAAPDRLSASTRICYESGRCICLMVGHQFKKETV